MWVGSGGGAFELSVEFEFRAQGALAKMGEAADGNDRFGLTADLNNVCTSAFIPGSPSHADRPSRQRFARRAPALAELSLTL